MEQKRLLACDEYLIKGHSGLLHEGAEMETAVGNLINCGLHIWFFA
jgi:hypothetical protein